ncbi:MAG: DnaJ C-terminal domain-containing protein, partial [Sphaerospermopsis kisseleviana]
MARGGRITASPEFVDAANDCGFLSAPKVGKLLVSEGTSCSRPSRTRSRPWSSGGGQAGDLYLRVRFERHPEFIIEGTDVIHEIELPVTQAVLGGEVMVPTLDGRA